jgi:twitching motility protein PilT
MEGNNPELPPSLTGRTAQVLKEGLLRGASDWHFTPGTRARLRVEGDIKDLECDKNAWSAAAILESWSEVTNQIGFDNATAFHIPDDRSVTALGIDGKRPRFRIHAKEQFGGMGYNLRILSDRPRKLTELKTPPVFQGLCQSRDSGLLLVCGATGSGKSTTLAATIDDIITKYAVKVDTFESPIETLFTNDGKKGLIQQHEVPLHIDDYAKAAFSALRDDPDIVMFAELRDNTAIYNAVEVAKTGHLVFGTLHTGTAIESLSRLMAARPAGSEDSYLQEVAQGLVGVLCQRLIKNLKTGKRVPVYELMIVNQTIAGVIMRADFKQLHNAISNGRNEGMFSFDDCMVQMIKDGDLDIQSALAGSRTPRDTLTHFVNLKLISSSEMEKLKQTYVV